MTEFTISANDCRSIASMIHLTDQSLIHWMDAIHCRISDGKLVAIATDRYKIGTWTTENIDTDVTDSIDFVITQGMAKWLTAIKLPKGSRGTGISFTLNEHELLATYSGQSYLNEFRITDGIFDKLAGYMNPTIAEQTSERFCLSFKQLADLGKVIDRDGKKIDRLEFLESARTNGRPAPFVITAQGVPEFKALLQPNFVK